ncbi:DUF262 domain-containing protein [Pyruvatibacter sp.]|uniref:GmrSD restriction endonuclease domain-containing protein n=1 Tax=Pyruvatibacter sp. TaxID=1981328 RepID=UPI00326726AE
MEARSKTIEQWFATIEQGQVKLPRFQRHEAWRPQQIAGLFGNILRSPSLPLGVLLVLDVGDKEPFHSRALVGAPSPSTRPQMQLLDGQQRMTALWRALTNDYEDLKAFVRLIPQDEEQAELGSEEDYSHRPSVEIVKRWDRKGVTQPVWADDPVAAISRGLAPLSIFRPGVAGETLFKEWRVQLRTGGVYTDEIGDFAGELRKRLQGYGLPFLSLPVGTSRETALEVFINMNTSASPLTDYDIVVAQFEEGAGESLHEKVEALLRSAPLAKNYGKTEDVLLSVGALLLEKPPLKKTYLEEDFASGLGEVWKKVETGVDRGFQFLAEEGLLNEKTVPSDVAVYLTCALWGVAADLKLDKEGNARSLIRKALWRACWTDRYGKTASTRAFADFRVLRAKLRGESQTEPELFDEKVYGLPAIEEVVLAGWPVRKERLPRAILATSLRRKAQDFADGTPINHANIRDRELDHLYSIKFLDVERSSAYANRAVNCALISSATNRNKSGEPPSIFITKRAEASNLGEEMVRWRLATHLVPYDALVADNYDEFLEARAELIIEDMKVLCNGGEPTS